MGRSSSTINVVLGVASLVIGLVGAYAIVMGAKSSGVMAAILVASGIYMLASSAGGGSSIGDGGQARPSNRRWRLWVGLLCFALAMPLAMVAVRAPLP